MKEIHVEELKSIQMDILDKVAAFCAENKIKYSLSSGTLIGAVRHKGYIPWDDDIDIYMLRRDYECFVEGFNGSYDGYRVQSLKTTPNYSLAYAKVERTNTIMREGFGTQLEIGVNIDVFPVDGVPDDYEQRKKFFKKIVKLRNQYVLKILPVSLNKRGLVKNIILVIGKMWYSHKSLNAIARELDSYIDKDNDNTKYVCNLTTDNKIGAEFTRVAMSDVLDMDFEDRTYKVMVGWDEYLTKSYGDYMKLPPENKRVSVHDFQAFWK